MRRGRSVAEKYRPGNGSEGDGFFENWCSKCARDTAMREGKPVDECDDSELCPIIASALAFEIDDPQYPVEWIIDESGPTCTAFVLAGTELPCTHTIELFP